MTYSCKIPSIVFEGSDGTGKSTLAKLVTDKLNNLEIPTKLIRNVGSCGYSEEVRERLVTAKLNGLSNNTVAHLIASAFYETIDGVIKPANKQGIGVVMDRYCDSMHIYQGLSIFTPELVASIKRHYTPTITFMLDATPENIAKRVAARNDNDTMDSIDLQDIAWRRYKYLNIYHEHGKDIPMGTMILLDANKSPEELLKDVWLNLENYL